MRSGRPAFALGASRWVISCKSVCPPVLKSLKRWLVWHQLPLLFPLYVLELRFRLVIGSVKNLGRIFI